MKTQENHGLLLILGGVLALGAIFLAAWYAGRACRDAGALVAAFLAAGWGEMARDARDWLAGKLDAMGDAGVFDVICDAVGGDRRALRVA